MLDEYFQISSTIVNSVELEGGLSPGVWITSYSGIARATCIAKPKVKMLIMDEAHKLKDSKSKAYQFVGQFESIAYKIMLSATPDSGKNDLRILLAFLYGETDEGKYRDKFENESKYRTNTKKMYLRPAIKREIKLEKLDSSEHKDVYRKYVELFNKLPNRLFASIAYKVLSSSLSAAITFLENVIEKSGSSSQYIDNLFKSDGEMDLDDEWFQDEQYEDSDYDGEQSHDVDLLRNRFLEEIAGLSDKMKNLLNSRGEWKYPHVKDICHTAANKKTVIFATYKQSLYGLMEALQDEFDIRDLSGETDIHQRNNIVDWFKNNVTEQDKPKVILLGNVGCEGLDFETSSTLINFDMDYNPTVIEQRIGRVDRLKQERESITVHNFVDGISDVRIYEY
ncbi:RNA polymerase-associated protein RapA [compost metagenome]